MSAEIEQFLEPQAAPGNNRTINMISATVAIAIVGLALFYALNLPILTGLSMSGEQFVSFMLALSFLLLYLKFPMFKKAGPHSPPWYDICAGVAGFIAAVYIGTQYTRLSTMVFFAPADGLIAAVVVIALALEGVRRTIGMPLVIVAGAFILYGLLGHYIPGTLQARPSVPSQLAFYLAFDANAILGAPLMVASTIVISFVLFGNLLTVTQGSSYFTDISLAMMGRYRGGSAKIAVVGSALFGTISGSAVGNVVATGVVTIPLMKKGGYPAHQAAAIEAVASTGGSLMPPVMGAAAFVMAEFLQITYGQVMVAAAIPAILYYAVLFMITDLEAARAGIARVEENLIPRALTVLKQGWFFPIPFVVLIYCLFSLNRRADESALWASLALVICSALFGYQGKRPTVMEIYSAIRDTGFAIIDIIMICCVAGVVIGILAVTGLGFGLTLTLVNVAGNQLFILLLLAAIISIVLGMGMPTIAVYVLLAALVAPAIVKAGVPPIAAHLFVLYFGMMSFITPPVAVAAFAAATIAKADPFRTGFTSMRFGWIAYIIPFLFCYSPTLIMQGSWLAIGLDFATAMVGIWFISAAVIGFALIPSNIPVRLAYLFCGFMLLIPASLLGAGHLVNGVGLLAGVALVAREFMQLRNERAAAPARAA